MSSLEDPMRRPGYSYIATNPHVPSHLSPVTQVVVKANTKHNSGKATIKSFQSQPYDRMNHDTQCQGFAKVLGRKLISPRGAGMPPESLRSQMRSTECVDKISRAKISRGNPMVKKL